MKQNPLNEEVTSGIYTDLKRGTRIELKRILIVKSVENEREKTIDANCRKRDNMKEKLRKCLLNIENHPVNGLPRRMPVMTTRMKQMADVTEMRKEAAYDD